jgi:hypothetical protein
VTVSGTPQWQVVENRCLNVDRRTRNVKIRLPFALPFRVFRSGIPSPASRQITDTQLVFRIGNPHRLDA